MRDTLLEKADYVMLKLSPMLDWRKAAADMGAQVGEVHIVSAGNECKELLLVMSRKYTGIERIYCVNDGQTFSFTPEEAANAAAEARNRTTAHEQHQGQHLPHNAAHISAKNSHDIIRLIVHIPY